MTTPQSNNNGGITNDLLDALMSPHGGIRQQAEAVYASMPVVQQRLPGLVGHVSHSVDTANTSRPLLAAVLLRRDILKVQDVTVLQQLMEPLWQAYSANSSNSAVTTQLGHCVTEVIASLQLVHLESAQTALQQVLQQQQSSSSSSSMEWIASVAERAPVAFTRVGVATWLPQWDPTLQNCAPKTMRVWTQVLVQAAIASTIDEPSLLSNTTPKNLDALTVQDDSIATKYLAPCLVRVMQWMVSSVTTTDIDSLEAVQESLQNVAQSLLQCPSLVAGVPAVLDAVMQGCLQVATHCLTVQNNQEDHHPVGLAALQVLANLLLVGDIKRRILTPQKANDLGQAAVTLLVPLFSFSEEGDDTEWAQEAPTLWMDAGSLEEEGDIAFCTSLLETFLRQSSPQVLSVLLGLVDPLLSTSTSTHARAGLHLLECAMSATPLAMAPHIPVVLQGASRLANNSSNSPRVQYQALRVLGALCEAYPTMVQAGSYAPLLLEPMALALGSPVSKVTTMASLGIVSYCRGGSGNIESSSSIPSEILSGLLQALVHGPLSSWNGMDAASVVVKVRAMGATACLAEATGDAFQPYYAQLMPGFLAVIVAPQQQGSASNTTLVGAAVEAATIVGQAVGDEYFANDAVPLLDWILPVLDQYHNSSADDALFLEQLLSSCARIASVLGERFSYHHLQKVLPHLLERAQTPPDVSVAEGDETKAGGEETHEDGIASMTVAVPGRGFTTVTLNTSQIQEVAQATRSVYELTKAVAPATFAPFCETCVQIFLPLVEFPYSPDVRSTAAQTVAAVFDVIAEVPSLEGLAQAALPRLVKSMAKQVSQEDTTDMEALYSLADALSEVLYIVHRSDRSSNFLVAYSADQSKSTIESCMTAMAACLQRRSDLTKVLCSGVVASEDEKSEYESLLGAEQQLLTPLVDSIGYNIKLMKGAILAAFDNSVLPCLGSAVVDTKDVRASISILLLLDDIVEHCHASESTKYVPQLLQGVLAAFRTDEKDLVQAAVYGVAQMARRPYNTVLSPNMQTIVQKLLQLTSVPKAAVAEDTMFLVEIAVSALASLTLFGPFTGLKFVSHEQLLTRFISHLPIQQDYDEAKLCHQGLCGLLESGSIDLSTHAGSLTNIIATILQDVEEGEEVATPDCVERLTGALYDLRSGNETGSAVQQAFSNLDAETQQTVNVVIGSFSQSRTNLVTP